MPRMLFTAALLTSLIASVVHAEDQVMNMFMKNTNGRAVVIELFSQTRDMRWPGNDKVYLLEPAEQKSAPITCEGGERICYGAWLNGNDSVTWGVGPDDDQACDDCCSLCAGSATVDIIIE